jgi:two-component system LytT family response regulator
MKESTEGLTAYLVDDEPLALKRLNKLLAATGSVQVVGSTTDQNEAVTFLDSHKVDVLFLDIQMPERNGFQLLAQLREQPLVIFTTAYERYAIQAFEVNSIDYLLKPVDEEQLRRALLKIRRLSETSNAIRLREQIQAVASHLADHRRTETLLSDRITFRVGDRIVLEDLNHITHFWAEDKLTFAATDQGTKYIADYSVADLEQKLGPKGFVRIHRATLVNVAFVGEFHRWFGGRLLVRLKDNNKTKLPVSRANAVILRQRLGL